MEFVNASHDSALENIYINRQDNVLKNISIYVFVKKSSASQSLKSTGTKYVTQFMNTFIYIKHGI